MTETLEGSLRALLDLFGTKLADVKFPGTDHASLVDASDEVDVAALAVAEAEAALEAARKAHAERMEHLLQKAQRALSYARVYAEGNAELEAELDAIVLSRAKKPAKSEATEALALTPPAPRRRGRPAKTQVVEIEEEESVPADIVPS